MAARHVLAMCGCGVQFVCGALVESADFSLSVPRDSFRAYQLPAYVMMLMAELCSAETNTRVPVHSRAAHV
jgi:hypothetical protein